MLLAGKSVIVTGVGPGMGRQLALIAASEGARVAVAARSEGFIHEVESAVGQLESEIRLHNRRERDRYQR